MIEYRNGLSIAFVVLTLCFVSTAYAQGPLVFGVHPFLSEAQLKEKFTPFTTYLKNELGQDVVLRIGGSYKDHVAAIGKDLVDLAYIGPYEYTKMVKQYGPKPLVASQETNGSATFHGVIIARSDSAATSLSDVAGDIAFVDPNSTMGYVLPTYMLLQKNPEVLREKRYQFLKSHENVALGVLIGTFEAGTVKQEVFDEYKKEGLKSLEMTPAVAEHLFVASKSMDKNLLQSLRQAMFKLKETPAGLNILQTIKPTITGLVPVNDSDYEPLRNIINELDRESLIR